MKKIAACIVAAILVFACIEPPQSAEAKTLTQLKQERETLQKKTEEAKKALEEAKNKKQSVQEEIDTLDQALIAAQAEFDQVQADLDFVTDKLKKSETELETAIQQKDKQMEVFSKRIKFIYERGNIGYLDILLKAGSFGELLTRMQYVNDIMDYDNQILTNLKEKEAIIKQKTEDIKQEKAETEALAAEKKEKADSLNGLLSQKKDMLKSFENDEAKAKQLIESNEKASQSVEKMIQQATASTPAASSSGGTYQVYTGGKLNWPVPSRAASASSLSSGYVGRKRPIGRGYEFHTGYDIPAPYGSDIVAAEAGTVITAGWVRGYGNTIIINHGGGLSTLYGHNSRLVVSVGQKVSRGQVVAKCGSTGNSTGNHCHFEVRINGAHTSPEPYLGVRNIAS